MSEAIKIKEGGVDRSQNQINKLKTNTVGGGVCFWVPETERQTDDKRITENGTYTAEEEGLYGYDEIDVSISNTGKMSGKGADGNDYVVDIDDNGYIVETKIPSFIRIETLPDKMSYNDGDTVDYSGIIVGAYDAEGNRMQEVPFNELIFSVTTATAEGEPGYSSDLDTSPLIQPLRPTGKVIKWVNASQDPEYPSEEWDFAIKGVEVGLNNTKTRTQVIGVASEAGGVVRHGIARNYKTGEEARTERYALDSYSHDGKVVYYYEVTNVSSMYGENSSGIDVVVPKIGIPESARKAIAWTLMYGSISGYTYEDIPVSWNIPTSGGTLSDSYTIQVAFVENGTAHSNEGGFEGGGSEHGF